MPKIEDENLVALPICIEIYLGIMVNNNMKKLHLKKTLLPFRLPCPIVKDTFFAISLEHDPYFIDRNALKRIDC